jgi:hypothetical protein
MLKPAWQLEPGVHPLGVPLMDTVRVSQLLICIPWSSAVVDDTANRKQVCPAGTA